MYKGVETYWKNSTPPEEDEGRSGHWKSFKTQIDIRSKYSLLQMSLHTYKLLGITWPENTSTHTKFQIQFWEQEYRNIKSYLARKYNYKYQNANFGTKI